MLRAPPPDPVEADFIERLRCHLQLREGGPVSRIETHISDVLLTPHFAFKIKKPVQLPFLDFSTLAARQRCCEAELRLNRRLAPQLYLDVVPVRGSRDAPTLDDDGPVIEYAVKMRRFDPGSLMSEHLAHGTLEPAHLDRLAQRLAEFHAAAPAAAPDGGFGAPGQVAAAAWKALEGVEAMGRAASCTRLRGWLQAQVPQLEPHWLARQADGRVREGHGDLHLANAVVLGDEVTAFDCIEFDPALRWIDVLADAGFLVMDLMAHGRRDLAFRFLNAYLEHGGDYHGLPVLRFYLVYRALVRAQVRLIRGQQAGAAVADQPSADDYLALADAVAASADARLLITHGLPGSGKTFVSQQLLEHAGAIRIRSDVERKRLFGLAALDRSRMRNGRDIYGAADTARTYERLEAFARIGLQAGWPTIVDAAFGRRDERSRFEDLARDEGCPFVVLDCAADAGVLRARVSARAARGDDASEADVAVLERLQAVREPLDDSERPAAIRVDTGQALDASALTRRWLRQGGS